MWNCCLSFPWVYRTAQGSRWGVCVQSLGLRLGCAAVTGDFIPRRPEACAQVVSTPHGLTQNLSQPIPFKDYFLSLRNETSDLNL